MRTRSPGDHFGVGLARAVGGAVIFALPLLMTMEMWSLGFSIDRVRLALLLALNVPLLVGLSHFSGFEETFELLQDGVDAFVAYAVGFIASALILVLLGVVTLDHSRLEMVGMVSMQAVPASIGALLAQSQLGGEHAGEKQGEGEGGERDENEASSEPPSAPRAQRPAGYWSQLFLMAVGALFLGFNIAPTEEVAQLAYMMSLWQALAMVALSLLAMHAFVYALEFRGQESAPEGERSASVFLRFTVVGYAIVLLISAYVLWTFGRLDGVGRVEAVTTVIVLAFPGAIGAAAARLIL